MNSRNRFVALSVAITVAAALGVVYLGWRGDGPADPPTPAVDRPPAAEGEAPGGEQPDKAAVDKPEPKELQGVAREIKTAEPVEGQPAELEPERKAPAVRVRTGKVTVRGALESKVVRRVLGGHLAEVKRCYHQALKGKPGLAGQVTLQFTVSSAGKVVSSLVQRSTMENREMESCISGAARRWLFPAPKGGGIAIVSALLILATVGD